ncbi:Uncharacterized protein PHSC3_000052 [Chlamydiales bacterium STE3]|nr:Uncharacterized protein PHSC3_000052 [Chlamydiales bacterium STE3]
MESLEEIMDSKFLARVEDVPVGKSLKVSLSEGNEIALFNIKGLIFALDNACPHMGGPLAEGEIDGSCITCPWHGWQFNIESGMNISGLGEDATTIRIQVLEGNIYLA